MSYHWTPAKFTSSGTIYELEAITHRKIPSSKIVHDIQISHNKIKLYHCEKIISSDISKLWY